MTTPALQARYAIVSHSGWWQGSESDDVWGSPYSAQLFDDPVDALNEILGLGWDVHIATVVVERRA